MRGVGSPSRLRDQRLLHPSWLTIFKHRVIRDVGKRMAGVGFPIQGIELGGTNQAVDATLTDHEIVNLSFAGSARQREPFPGGGDLETSRPAQDAPSPMLAGQRRGAKGSSRSNG
jgi:hypothetical protein